MENSPLPFTRRAIEWDTSGLPVPADVCVYTQTELAELEKQSRRFYQEVMREAVWVYRWNEENFPKRVK